MIRTHFLLFFRSVGKYKGYFFINVVGLLVSMVCVVLMLLYVNLQWGYDAFHQNAESIYRVTTFSSRKGREEKLALAQGGIKKYLVASVPEVEASCRILKYVTHPLFKVADIAFTEDDGFFVDNDFNKVFNFRYASGNPLLMFAQPNTLAISKKMAVKYFNTTDVIGKAITIDLGEGKGSVSMIITGVLKEVPTNSHLQFDYLISGSSLDWWEDSLNDNSFYVYCKLKENRPKNALVKIEKLLEDRFQEYFKQRQNQLQPQEFYKNLLQPITSIHFDNSYLYEVTTTINSIYPKIMLLLVLLIVVISGVNYNMLNVSFFLRRAKEMGIRMLLGSSGIQILRGYAAEALFLSLVILTGTILVTQLLLKNEFIQTIIGVNSIDGEPEIIGLTFFLLIIICFLGLLVQQKKLSQMRATKRDLTTLLRINKGNAGNFMLAIQVTISIALISFALIVVSQVNFIKNIDLGFRKENVLLLNPPGSVSQSSWNEFRKRLKSEAMVSAVGQSVFHPFENYFTTSFSIYPAIVDRSESLKAVYTYVDEEYISSMGMRLLKGEDFSDKWSFDKPAVIINEAAFKKIGEQDILGKQITTTALNGFNQAQNATVIGVVRDFHTQSFDKRIEPILFIYTRAVESVYKLSVRLPASASAQNIERVRQLWKQSGIEASFEYTLLEDGFNEAVKPVFDLTFIIVCFSIISILITAAGLVGLMGSITSQKVKEIAVRKVLGASVAEIVLHLNRGTIVIFMIACAIAIPSTIYFGGSWLTIFAYRASINYGVLLVAVLSVFVLICVTVSFQSLAAASKKPVEYLKSE